MYKVEYNKKEYTYRYDSWSDENGLVAPKPLQIELSRKYFETIDFSGLTNEELYDMGVKFKSVDSNRLSLTCFYAVIEAAMRDNNFDKVRYLLPCITSIYRGMNKPADAVELYQMAKDKYGEQIFNAAFLTSVAAAYVDLKDKRSARKCIEHAKNLNGGQIDKYMQNVLERME